MGKIDINQFNQELAHFTGSECAYRHQWLKGTYTEGVRFVARELHAYWLLDLIFSLQMKHEVKGQTFQVWKLTVVEGKSGTLTLEDGDYNTVLKHELSFTDFPLPEFTLWLTNNTLLLPSEY